MQSRRYYLAHADQVKANVRAWRADNPEALREQRARYRAANKAKIAEWAKQYRERTSEKIRVEGKNKRDALFARVVAAYGGACACCGEPETAFLTIDHVNNDGAKHRKTIKAGQPFYRWLEKQQYPQNDFRLLCWNCNSGRARNGGRCPHEVTK